MSKLLIGLFSSVLFISLLQAQDPVGHYFDINGEYINGYLDPFSYQPDVFLDMPYAFEGYEEAVVYNLDSTSTSCQLKMLDDYNGLIRPNDDSDANLLKPSNCYGFTLGIDSFFVIQNIPLVSFSLLGYSTEYDPFFAMFIAESGDYSFAKTRRMGSSANRVVYLVKTKQSEKWIEVPNKKEEFYLFVEEHFSKVLPLMINVENGVLGPDLESHIDRPGLLKTEDFESLLKTIRYWDKYKRNEFLYYDQYWNEVSSPERSTFSGQILNLNDSIWEMKYYKGERPICHVQLSSVPPHRKNGFLFEFDEFGNKRKELFYQNDQLESEKYFDKNDSLELEMTRSRTEKKSRVKREIRKVVRHNGYSARDIWPSLNHVLIERLSEDSIERKLEFEYRLHTLDKIFSHENGVRQLQMTDLNYDFELVRMQAELSYFMRKVELGEAAHRKVRGVYLVRVKLNEKGEFTEVERLNDLFPSVDSVIDDFLNIYLMPGAKRELKLRPYMLNDEKVSVEMVLPFKFKSGYFFR